MEDGGWPCGLYKVMYGQFPRQGPTITILFSILTEKLSK